MDSLKETYKKDKFLHHAYLIDGEYQSTLSELKEFFKETLSIVTAGNPDVIVQEMEILTIDDARALKEMASRKSFSGGKKIFVIGAHFFTHEAQNSLLKLFEEPTPDTHFFIITRKGNALLPTLLSRLSRIAIAQTGNIEIKSLAEKLLKLSPGERLRDDTIKDIIEEKDKIRAIALLDQFVKALHEKEKVTTKNTRLFEELTKCRGYLNDRAPSVKLILEYTLLVLPQG
ncbi:MAG: hypothetical protein AAB488_01635 [Patescibacteria group bacterium]